MILSICIPTLNRALYLKKNLNRLISIIDELNIIDKIEIVVSDNNSEDSTNSVLNEFKNLYSKRYNLLFWRQETRLVMQENLLFVVSKAQAKYFMWLGDDDFINKDYLSNSLDAIINKNVGLILPSYKFINNEGVLLNGGRDLRLKNRIYSPSFKNCRINSWRGHQLSGLVANTDILKDYRKYEINNIYPCIFFSCMGTLNYKTFHLTECPIEVTLVNQEYKAWGYGEDGLFDDIFDNYKKLPLTNIKKSILQLHFFYVQYWRLWAYKKLGVRKFLKAIIKILNTKNSTVLFKIFFLFLVFLRMIDLPLRKTAKAIILKSGLYK